jgi:hypothetical protein
MERAFGALNSESIPTHTAPSDTNNRVPHLPSTRRLTQKPHSEAHTGTRRETPKHLILLRLFCRYFSSCVFRPKIACQAPEPPKPNKQNEIELAC